MVASLVPTRVWRSSGLATTSVCTWTVTGRTSTASTIALDTSGALAKAVSVLAPSRAP